MRYGVCGTLGEMAAENLTPERGEVQARNLWRAGRGVRPSNLEGRR
jgi:hypothetical protein